MGALAIECRGFVAAYDMQAGSFAKLNYCSGCSYCSSSSGSGSGGAIQAAELVTFLIDRPS